MKFCMKCMSQYEDNLNICPICGFEEGTLPKDSRCIEGQVLAERYVVGTHISIDSWMVQYIGWDALTNKKVVINEYLPTRYAVRDPGNIELTIVKANAFRKYLSVLLKKARLLAETHLPDNISVVHECFEENKTAYIITEYKEGRTLTDYIERHKSTDIKTVERLFLPILKSIDKLHENGFIAGGFSPDNFILTDENKLVFVNYIGNMLYNVSDSNFEMNNGQKDKYFPIEKINASETVDLSPENDVYSAAIIMCEMIGVNITNPKARYDTYKNKNKDILKIPPSCIPKSDKYKEKALINAIAIRPSERTSDIETFIKELTSGKDVNIKTKRKSKFPLWAKIAIPAVAVAGIAAAIILPIVLNNKQDADDNNTMIEGQTVVPSIVNRSFKEASDELQQRNLLIEVEGKTVEDSKDADTVLTQNTAKGSIVSENTIIGVTLSTQSGEFTMPNFLGIDLHSCTEVLENIGINYSITEEYNATISSGCVVSQSLSPYSKVKAGDRADIVVSKGPEPTEEEKNGQQPVIKETTVKDLVDKPYSEVIQENSSSSAQPSAPVEVVERRYDDTKPEGTIVRQSVPAGSTQPSNEPIKIVVTTANENVIVPDVVYLDQERAQKLLSYYGFKSDITYEENETVAEGLIFNQTPSPGDPGKIGDTLKLTVSTGKPLLKMPDTVGKTKEEAAKILKDSGLAVSYTFESNADKPKDEILKQSIAANSDVRKGAEVILTVNSGTSLSDISEIPDIVGMDVKDADKIVTDAGFNLIIYADEEHPNTEGIIAAQGPKAGLYAKKGSDMVVILAVDNPDEETSDESSAESSAEESSNPSFSLSKNNVSIGVGEEFVLEIDLTNVSDFNALDYDITNKEVADVTHIDKETLAMTFRGLSAGKTDVIIKYGDLVQTCTIEVGNGSTSSSELSETSEKTESSEIAEESSKIDNAPDIVISPESVSLKKNETFVLSIKTKNIEDLSIIEYDISDESIVTVEKINRNTLDMTYRAIAAGDTEIKISGSGVERICKVHVAE